jgi:hypothetical protein
VKVQVITGKQTEVWESRAGYGVYRTKTLTWIVRSDAGETVCETTRKRDANRVAALLTTQETHD